MTNKTLNISLILCSLSLLAFGDSESLHLRRDNWVVRSPLTYNAGTRSLGLDITSLTALLPASGISSLNGLTGATQTFATPGTTGTAPNWSSSGTTHTLNIPMAATSSVTAGLISKTQYDTFNAKQAALSTGTSNQWIRSDDLAPHALASADIPNNAANTSGNAATATALAANPTDCASDRYATTIDASGNLTCATVTNAGLAGSIAASKLVGSDIDTVGTVTTGTWNATPVTHAYGGTDLTSPGAAGNQLRSDGTNWTSGPPAVGGYPTKSITQFREFNGNVANQSDDFLSSTVGGTSAINAVGTSEISHPGIVDQTTGTSTTGRACMATNAAAHVIDGTLTMIAWVKFPVLADATDDYTYYFGLSDSITASAPTNTAVVRYQRSTSTSWQCVTKKAGSSSTQTGSAVAASTWYRLKVVATTSDVQCYVDDVQIGSNITTNIPTAAMAMTASMIKTAGTTSRIASLDAVWFNYLMSTAR